MCTDPCKFKIGIVALHFYIIFQQSYGPWWETVIPFLKSEQIYLEMYLNSTGRMENCADPDQTIPLVSGKRMCTILVNHLED